MNNKLKSKVKISFNSPVILTFAIACVVILIFDYLTNGWLTWNLFSVHRSSLLSPLTYIRFFGHVFGHADWSHLINNTMYILILGPLLEEKYGSANMTFIILSTALVTGIASFILFPNVCLLGASGVVFALILLSSFTSIKEGSIPLTFILVAVIYIGQQVFLGITVDDNISNFGHIIGGVCGAALGYELNKNKLKKANSSVPYMPYQ